MWHLPQLTRSFSGASAFRAWRGSTASTETSSYSTTRSKEAAARHSPAQTTLIGAQVQKRSSSAPRSARQSSDRIGGPFASARGCITATRMPDVEPTPPVHSDRTVFSRQTHRKQTFAINDGVQCRPPPH